MIKKNKWFIRLGWGGLGSPWFGWLAGNFAGIHKRLKWNEIKNRKKEEESINNEPIEEQKIEEINE